MKKNSLITFITFICLCFLEVSVCFGQETFIYKGILKDSITQKALTDVKIFLDKDSIGLSNNEDGSFLLSIKEGSVIRFRKSGYRWLNLKIEKHSPKNLEMIPSKRSEIHDQFDEVIIDGKKLPKEEWDDINPEYFSEVGVNMENNKVFLIAKSKQKY